MANNPNLEKRFNRVDKMSEGEMRKYLADMEAEARRILGDPDASEEDKTYARRVLKTLGLDVPEEERAIKHVAMRMGAHVSTPGIQRRGTTQTLGFMTPEQAHEFLRTRGEM